jgi:multiple sugar transport system permease protein
MVKETRVYILLLLPSLIGLSVFYIVPFFISVYYSLINNAVLHQFVGLNNFIDTWRNQAFALAIHNTFIFMGISIPLNLGLALLLALVLRMLRPAAQRFLMLLLLLPLVIPSGSIVFFWDRLIAFNGMVNRLFFADTPIHWLNTNNAMIFIIGIFIWKNIGFIIILFHAGLDYIPKEYYEYAVMEGSGRIRQFFSITLVYLEPTILMTFMLSVVNSFKVFREVYLITGTHPN